MFPTDMQKTLPCSLELICLSESDYTIFISSEGQVEDSTCYCTCIQNNAKCLHCL